MGSHGLRLGMTTALVFLWTIGGSVLAKHPAQRVVVSVLSNAEELGEAGAQLFREEVREAAKQGLKLAFVLPTGSTPIPMYRQIQREWEKNPYSLEEIEFYNSDEYVGLAADDPHSYAWYFSQNLFKNLLDKPLGIRSENIHLFKSSLTKEQAAEVALERRNLLRKRLDDPKWRVVIFGGIGVDPTHVAFNDFRQELEEIRDEDAKLEFALHSVTRVVQLDEGTRQANKRFFDYRIEQVPKYAMTIGFQEILDAARVIIMASSPNKKESIRKMFADAPSYRVPASLLRLRQGPMSILLTRDAYMPIDAAKADVQGLQAVLEAAPDRASVLHPQTQEFKLVDSIHGVSISPSARVMLLLDSAASKIEKVLISYVKKGQLEEFSLEGKPGADLMQSLKDRIEAFKPQVIFVPAQLASPSLDNRLHLLLQHTLSAAQSLKEEPPQFVYYETAVSRTLGYNWLLSVTEQDLQKQLRALDHHRSQLRRSPIRDIPYLRAKETWVDFQSLRPLEAGSQRGKRIAGLEAYKWYRLRRGVFSFEEATQLENALIDELPFGESDQIVMIAPHPDDVEIGAAGFLMRASDQRIPATIMNVTSGAHAKILKQDAWENEEARRLGLVQDPGKPGELLDEPKLRTKVRSLESLLALRELNPSAKLMGLELEFYDNGYLINEADKKKAYQAIEHECAHIRNKGKLVVVMPVTMDKHVCHRRSTELFLDQLQLFSQKNPEQAIYVVYYRTPWTGASNLYLYSDAVDGASGPLESEALIGLELLLGKASDSVALRRKLPVAAWGLQVF